MKNKDIFDLAKYILAYMVVAIHMGLYQEILFPWLRIAVPLFYIISSYLLFSRVNSVEEKEKRECIKKFIVRNIKYYLFWFVCLLPFTIYYRREWWIENKGISFFLKVVSNMLFSSSFPASWYIIGSIWAVIILYVTRKINYRVILCCMIFIYIACCMRSGYYFLIKDYEGVIKLTECYEKIFTSPVLSFPIATFWMFVGKMFVDNHIPSFRNGVIIASVVCSAILLWFEWKTLVQIGGNIRSDILFFLAPLCISIFALLKKIDINIKNARTIRIISAVMYPMHFVVIFLTTFVFSRLGIQLPLVKYLVVVFICHIAACIIMKCEKVEKFSLLRWSH